MIPPLGANALTGDLVRSQGLSAVYYVSSDGSRIVFPDEATYFSWYADFSQVKFLTDAEIAALPIGGVATRRPGVSIVKTPLSPKVYAVAHGGVLRWISTEELAKMIFGDDWSLKVTMLPEEFLTAYSFGEDITSGGQYWWKREMDASPDILADREPRLAPGYEPSADEEKNEPVPSAPEKEELADEAKVLYVLWDPKRPAHPAPEKSVLERVLFGSSPSLADYYDIESGNRLKISRAGVLGWYAAEKGPDYYWSDDVTAYDTGFKSGAAEGIFEALKKADVDFDFSAYDANRDGALSPSELAIFIVIPQLGEPADEIVTPFAAEAITTVTTLSDGSSSSETTPSKPFVADRVSIASVGKVSVGTPLGDRPAFGTLLHSFAKLYLQLDDLSASAGGSFSLMGNSRSDLRLDPYNRAKLGWVEPKVIPKSIEISSQRLHSGIANRAVIKVNREEANGPSLGTEYMLIENRERGVYDGALPDQGIAVWGVNGGSVKLIRLDASEPLNDGKALWHGGDFSEPTGLELNWASGTRSGVRILNVPPPSEVMDFTLEKKVLTEADLRVISPIQQ